MSQFHDLMRRLKEGVVPDSPGAQPQPAQPAAEAEARIHPTALYLQGLKVEGYEASMEVENQIEFQTEGFTLYVLFDPRDAEYFRLVLPNFWPIADAAERVRAERAADRVNRRVKVAKVHLNDNNMWAVVEMFVADPRHVLPVLRRAVRLLPEVVRRFSAAMDSFE